MHLIFIIEGLYIIFSLPFWSLILLLIILRFFLNISFKVTSLYSISDVEIKK